MIIIGYQGIGKSTYCRNSEIHDAIDLESSCFKYLDGTRPEGWELLYCKVAEDLSQQGFKVFTSSHAGVRAYLKNSKEKVYAIAPSPVIKDAWIKRLQDRYDADQSTKNFLALENAKDRLEENVKEIANDIKKTYFIDDIDEYNIFDMMAIIDII